MKDIKWLSEKSIKKGSSKHKLQYSRSRFHKDLGVIQHSSAFRRLSHKTQVHIAPVRDYVRTRLTHSIEVSQICAQLTRYLVSETDLKKIFNNNEKNSSDNVCADMIFLSIAASLAHDIGHPPFGHEGENALNDVSSDLLEKFEGNKQNVHLILGAQGKERFDVSHAFLQSIIKYKKNDGNTKGPCYEVDREILSESNHITGLKEVRHPISFLMEASDDMAYFAADIEDAWELKQINEEQLKELLTKTLPKKIRFDEKDIDLEDIQKTSSFLIKKFIEHCCGRLKSICEKIIRDKVDIHNFPSAFSAEVGIELLYDSEIEKDLKIFKKTLYGEHILTTTLVNEQKSFSQVIIKNLWGYFEPLKVKKSIEDFKKSRQFCVLPLHLQKCIINIIESKSNISEKEILFLVRDYIAGMTDRYAIELYRRLYEGRSSSW